MQPVVLLGHCRTAEAVCRQQRGKLLNGVRVFNVLFPAAFPESALSGEDIHPVNKSPKLRVVIGTPETEKVVIFIDKRVAVKCCEVVWGAQIKHK